LLIIENEKLIYLLFKKAFSVALLLLSVSAYFKMVTESKCLTSEEGIQADYIVPAAPFFLFVGCHLKLVQYSSEIS